MKNLFLPIIALALLMVSPTFAQVSSRKQDDSASKVREGRRDIELPVLSTLSRALVSSSDSIVVSAWSGSLVFEGSTDNAFETTFAITDPTADRTITFPNDTGTVALNPLAGTLTFEGATADAHEIVLLVTDPTADVNYTLPDTAAGTYGLVTSTLALNGIGAANAVWGGSASIITEGTTADGFETTLAFADATADATQTVPATAASGTVQVFSAAQAEAATDTLTAAQLYGGFITNTGAVGAAVYTLPAPVVGMHFTVVLTVAQDVDVNPADGTQILTLTNATGDAVSSAATIGNFITLRAISTTQWIATESSGTWSDAN